MSARARRRPTPGLAGAFALACGVGSIGGDHETQKLSARDAAAGDIFGAAVALDGDIAVVAAEYDDLAGKDSGAVHVYRRAANGWTAVQKLAPGDGAAGDNFGRAVAVAGDVIVVGAHWDDTPAGRDAGSVYVFRRVAEEWRFEQKLTARDGRANARFGVTVDIDRTSASGERLAVGAWLDGGAGAGAGAAYVFRRAAGEWQEEQRITPKDARPGANFGRSVALSGDRLLVGSWKDDARGTSAGAAYVFGRAAGPRGAWTEELKLVPSDLAAGDLMGFDVALDGEIALVGAHGRGAGRAWIFRRRDARWVEEARLAPTGGGRAGDAFGWAVALQGDLALVGAQKDDSAGKDSGCAWIFRRDPEGWKATRKLVASDGAAGDVFGFDVALDGRTALVGAWRDDHAGTESGSAYVFEL